MGKKEKKRILLIDDDKSFAKIVKMNLEKTGLLEITLAFKADEGLAKVEQEDPDAIILDIMMPGKDGYGVLEELRKPGTKRRPVIMLTGKDDIKSMGKAYELEADHYITKPFQIEDLLDAIGTVLHLAPAWEKPPKKEPK